jgi:hypothetical protein
VLGWSAVEVHTAMFMVLPPVKFHGVHDLQVTEPGNAMNEFKCKWP